MKKTARFIALILLPMILSSCYVSRAEKRQRTITVCGEGEVFVKNEKSVISLSVITKNPDAIAASEENAKKMEDVQTAIIREGIAKDYITTSDYHVYQESDYVNKREQNLYVVSNQINVSVSDIEKTSRIIDSATKAGANQFNGIRFYADNTKEDEKQSRILAIRDAEQKAMVYASTCGCEIVRLLTLNETSASRTSSKEVFVKNMSLDASSTPISAGSTTISASIEAVYEIK